jgi:hypothetical protein
MVASPMLTVTTPNGLPWCGICSASTEARCRSAQALARSSDSPGTIMTSSAPPRLNTWSSSRQLCESASDTLTSTSSPAGCP